jgi:hypothetical protein
MIKYDSLSQVPELLGKEAFETYNADAGGKTWDGKDIPAWENLTPEVRQHWISAALRIYSTTLLQFGNTKRD